MSNPLHARPDKLENAETVLYEIDLLRFAKDRLLSGAPFASDADEWVYLEAFLLHFRNVVEFFRAQPARPDDLSIARPNDIWENQQLPAAADLNQLARPDLWNKYEGNIRERISKYLQHCTTQRVIKKKWDVQAMYEDVRPVLEKFEALLPAYKPATKPVVPASQPTSAAATLATDEKATVSGARASVSPSKNP